MWDEWVIDAGMSRDGTWCLVPVEGLGTPEQKFVIGMNFLVGEGSFAGHNVVGAIHEDGQAAVVEWWEGNAELLDKAAEEAE